MKKVIHFSTPFLAFLLFFISACSQKDSQLPNTNPPSNSGDDWFIPSDKVFDGGPGKDGIPSVDDPVFENIAGIDFMKENDLIIGIKIGDEIRGYPHPILDWHEIINDDFVNDFVAVTYCPLTGTAIGWDRVVDGNATTFGVSGLLYNSNLLPYDRVTNSNWSQMRLESVNGKLKGTEIKTYHLIETTWKTWKQLFPESRVLGLTTGFSRSYGVYPYGNYKTNNDYLIFPVQSTDTRLPQKERVLGVIVEGQAKVYRLGSFNANAINVEQDAFRGVNMVIAGSESKNFLVAFRSELTDGTALTFAAIDEGAVIMQDNEGTKWNVFGHAVEGPRAGEKLTPMISYIGYWFSWGAFYPGLKIFGN